MIKIQDGELADILPVELTRQPQVLGISFAIKQAYEALYQSQQDIYVYAFVDNAPEYVLDLLAIELQVRYYRQEFAIDVKRNLIKEALMTDAKDGTKFAVEKAIQTVFGNGNIEEWYEYSGVPNHFRVNLNVDNDYNLDNLLSILDAVKRKTARMDGITMYSDGHQAPVFFGSIIVERVEETIGCESIPDIAFFIGDNDEDEVIGDDNGRYLYGVTT